MSIRQFADAHRLKTSQDEDNTTVILGRDGQIYEHSKGMLGMIFISDRFRTREGWNTRRKQCEAAGMETHQDGDYEGTMLFNPKNETHAKLAIKIAGCRPRKQITDAQREALSKGRVCFPRLNPSVATAL